MYRNIIINAIYMAFSLIIILSTPSYAQDAFNQPMVVNVDGKKIFINQGFYENVGNESVFTIKHGNKELGKVKVTELYEHYCVCEPEGSLNSSSVKKGDSASVSEKGKREQSSASSNRQKANDQAEAARIKAEKAAQERAAKQAEAERIKAEKEEAKRIAESAKREEELRKAAEKAERDRIAAREKAKQDIQDGYLEDLADCTRTLSFSDKKGISLIPNVGILSRGYSIYNYINNISYINKHMNTMGGNRYNSGLASFFNVKRFMSAFGNLKNMNRNPNMGKEKQNSISVEVVYLTPDLLKSQATLFAANDDMYDNPEQVSAIADGLMQQMELGSYAVFQVTVKNDESSGAAAQLAPFKWKMSLITSNNEQIKAVKYDEALDKTLGAGQSTQGNIYFPLTDSQGVPIGKSNIKVKLESILGKSAVFSWNDSKGRPKTKGRTTSRSNQQEESKSDAQSRKQQFLERYNSDGRRTNRY